MSNGTHYEVLARKYRPQTFSELTGQEHVSRTLQNAIDTGRVAHAFLFTGARGVGKTSTARILAKTLNCERGVTVEPCNVCPLCVEITKGTSTDVFEIDGASNTGVDDIRELRDNIKYLPSHSRYKIFIIDEVHMLSNNAFNALLKTLEEPPEHVKFIFATTEPHKLPVTILSRCQRFDFKRVALPRIVERLRQIAEAEGIAVSDSALALVARKGDGSMRDALTAFDQVLACCGSAVGDEDVVMLLGAVDRRLLGDVAAAVFGGDTQGVLAGVKTVDGVGYNMRQFCQELIEYFRNLLVVRSVKRPEEILDVAAAELDDLRRQAEGSTPLDIQRRLTLLVKAESDMAHATFPRLVLEIALLKLATLEPVVPVQDLLEKIRLLETSAVHTPSLPWEAGRKTPAASAPAGNDQPRSQSSPRPPVQAHAKPATPAPAGTAAAGGHGRGWEQFVAHVVAKNPVLGSILEHGSPLKQEPGLLEIGFPAGSYYLSSIQDAGTSAEARGLAGDYFGRETVFRAIAIATESGDAPPSLIEKKKSEHEHRREELKQELSGHPVVTEAVRVFGSTITDVREI